MGQIPQDHPDAMNLSVIIPVYNERTTIALFLQRVREAKLEEEITVADDGSADGKMACRRCGGFSSMAPEKESVRDIAAVSKSS